MCIIVDPPVFVPMFKTSDPEHANYTPVYEWILHGHGKFVIGGESYNRELSKIGSVLKIITELDRKGKIVRAPTGQVNREEVRVKEIQPVADFDDPHLVALVRATKCRLICIRDPRSHRFLRSKELYDLARDRPSLYTRAKNRNLLCDDRIGNCCK